MSMRRIFSCIIFVVVCMPQCGEGGRMESLIPQNLLMQYLKEDSYATTKDEHENAIDTVYEWCHYTRGSNWVAENFRFIETELKIARESVAALLEEHQNKRWTLSHGIHRGTLISRDNAEPEQFRTAHDAYMTYLEHRNFYKSIGYKIWYATLTSPTGEQQTLESNPYI